MLFDLYKCGEIKKECDITIIGGGTVGLLVANILEEKGQHSRAIFGVDKLPRNFSVGLSCTFTLINNRH